MTPYMQNKQLWIEHAFIEHWGRPAEVRDCETCQAFTRKARRLLRRRP